MTSGAWDTLRSAGFPIRQYCRKSIRTRSANLSGTDREFP